MCWENSPIVPHRTPTFSNSLYVARHLGILTRATEVTFDLHGSPLHGTPTIYGCWYFQRHRTGGFASRRVCGIQRHPGCSYLPPWPASTRHGSLVIVLWSSLLSGFRFLFISFLLNTSEDALLFYATATVVFKCSLSFRCMPQHHGILVTPFLNARRKHHSFRSPCIPNGIIERGCFTLLYLNRCRF